MKLALLVYFAEMVDSLSIFIIIFGLILLCLVPLLFLNISWQKDFGDDNSIVYAKGLVRKLTKPFIVIGVFLIFISVLIPKEKTIYLMAGAYATEQIATNDRVQKIGSDVLEVIEGKLEKLKEDK